ncbi:SDR family NAD(P)-dependent oxidoreductase [Kerstersia sp.]|uniref:SDR family NAD(P)-dependent oxidoreductase n=1 Tax=Kerstersia sp. TaxID=1930783 RepID=UPI003F92E630
MNQASTPQPLTGQVAIVTGAARGIGLGIARRLSREGCQVVIWDMDLAPLADSGFEPALAQRVDIRDPDAIHLAVAEAHAQLGRIDILVNNAGINGPVQPMWEYTPQQWQQVMDINLSGVFYCCRAIVPLMRAAGHGRIINIASAAGKEAVPGITPYSASKHGVIGLTKSLARELAGEGVLVNAVAPVMTETQLLQQMTPAHIASSKAKIPMGRFLSIPEIAAMVAWIAGPDCTFTTGFTFDLSGGRANY